jgi:hypothetical protein
MYLEYMRDKLNRTDVLGISHDGHRDAGDEDEGEEEGAGGWRLVVGSW